ncbi:MAG: sigma-70 family RNA polymerase sigma factor [Acidobacteria bacterium]|nr:sigma-70 family RNA polymerase sigma factor [Acidobacteriota bacterium]
MGEQAGDVTQMLVAWSAGEPGAEERLYPLVYDELKLIARRYLRRERGGHTLQPTALVNEAYLRLIDQTRASWQNRAQFFGVASMMMRRILVNHARALAAGKRGAGARGLTIQEAFFSTEQDATDLLALDEALTRLAAVDERKSRVVELLYFGGLENREAAEVLGVSDKTVQRDWRMARLWLYRELTGRAEAGAARPAGGDAGG